MKISVSIYQDMEQMILNYVKDLSAEEKKFFISTSPISAIIDWFKGVQMGNSFKSKSSAKSDRMLEVYGTKNSFDLKLKTQEGMSRFVKLLHDLRKLSPPKSIPAVYRLGRQKGKAGKNIPTITRSYVQSWAYSPSGIISFLQGTAELSEVKAEPHLYRILVYKPNDTEVLATFDSLNAFLKAFVKVYPKLCDMYKITPQVLPRSVKNFRMWKDQCEVILHSPAKINVDMYELPSKVDDVLKPAWWKTLS